MRTNGDQTNGPNADRTQPNGEPTQTERQARGVTVAEASRMLGTSAEAVRMRIKRGTLKSTKIDGTVYVLLDDEQMRTNADPTADRTHPALSNVVDAGELIEALRSEVAFLRAELHRREEKHTEEARRRDHIIAALTQRIPELEPPKEAPPEPRESPVSASEESPSTSPPPEEQKRSWWRRIFEG